MKIRRFGQKPRHRGFARAGRPPKDHRGQAPGPHHAPQEPVAEQMILTDDLVECLRAQPIRERTRGAIGQPSRLEEIRRLFRHGSAPNGEVEHLTATLDSKFPKGRLYLQNDG